MQIKKNTVENIDFRVGWFKNDYFFLEKRVGRVKNVRLFS